MRNKRSSNFSDDKLMRLTVNIFPALLNKRYDGELPAGAPRTFWANAESLGREVDCDGYAVAFAGWTALTWCNNS